MASIYINRCDLTNVLVQIKKALTVAHALNMQPLGTGPAPLGFKRRLDGCLPMARPSSTWCSLEYFSQYSTRTAFAALRYACPGWCMLSVLFWPARVTSDANLTFAHTGCTKQRGWDSIPQMFWGVESPRTPHIPAACHMFYADLEEDSPLMGMYIYI